METKPTKEKERKPTRKQIRTMALVKRLGRRLQEEHRDELMYYFLAGMTRKEIAGELEVTNIYYNNQNNAIAAVNSAISGNAKGYLGVRYQPLVSKRKRNKVNRETQSEKVKRFKSFKLDECLNIEGLTENEMPKIPENQWPERRVEQSLLSRKLEEVMQTLSYREREVLRFVHGISGYPQCNYNEISKMFGITRERIRQIETGAIAKLAFPTMSAKLEGFVDNPPNWVLRRKYNGTRIYAEPTSEGEKYQIKQLGGPTPQFKFSLGAEEV